MLLGLQRILNCSKVQVAAAGLTSTWLAVRYAAADLPPTQRSALWVAFIGAAAVQLREIINAWTEEDVERVREEGTKARRDEGTKGMNAAPPSAVLGRESAGANVQKPSPSENRSPIMPPRTRLPGMLLACSLIALLAGCQSCPELAVYREGLHAVDEPLYQAHLLLLDDAVKANIRTDADRQVVQQGINAARGLYSQSHNATTQPAQ